MTEFAKDILTWSSIFTSFATIVISYTKTKVKIDNVDREFERLEKEEKDIIVIKEKLKELEKDQNEIYEKYEKLAEIQSEMSNCLKEVSTILSQFDKQVTSRLDRLEAKIDNIKLKAVTHA